MNPSMATYTQFGYSYPTPSQLLVAGQPTTGSTGSSGGGCCDSGRLLITDPMSGQSVCSCQYDTARLAALQSSYPRLTSGTVYSTTYPSTEQNPYPSIGMDTAAFYPTLGNHYSLKDGATPGDMSAWTGATLAQSGGYYPYDPTLAAYGYGAGYDLAARRKNATRESTATLKAWLNEHKKNPYPTKGEKIMLAIITKMTLTQVSTWFANARRRLKKENKMTWEPKNRVDDDDAVLSDDDDEEEQSKMKEDREMLDSDDERLCKRESDQGVSDSDVKDEPKSSDDDKTCMSDDLVNSTGLPVAYDQEKSHIDVKAESGVPIPATKPKIWSLADTAACKTPPPTSQTWFGNPGMFQIPSSLNSSAMYNRFPGLLTPVSPSYGYNGLLPSNSVSNHQTSSPNYPDTVQTDTPPQTPPNMKVPGILGPSNYNVGSNSSQYSPNSQNLMALGVNRGSLMSCDRDMSYHNSTSPQGSPFRQTYK